jgi:hypothetical protein
MSSRILPNGKAKKQSSRPALTTPKVALYMRVATEDQADRGTIEAQRDFLRQFASLYQLPVAGEYADDGVTGTLSLGGRPEGQRFLQDAEAGAFGCGGVYVGQNAGNRNGMKGAYSRCGRRHPDLYARAEWCSSRAVNAAWLESTVWEDCREVILHPGEALTEAQRQLHARVDQATRMEQQRSSDIQALADKVQERERVMTLYRRGRIPVTTVEAQLDAIAQEEVELRQQCSALESQKALAEASEAHMTNTRHLLQSLHRHLEDIDRTDDQVTKRQVIELLVHTIRVDTTADRKLSATITYAFSPERVACQSVHAT